jgi:hypothetical protein
MVRTSTPVYLAAPPTVQGAEPTGNGQATGTIMAIDPASGEPVVVVDHVDASASFDLH